MTKSRLTTYAHTAGSTAALAAAVATKTEGYVANVDKLVAAAITPRAPPPPSPRPGTP